MKNNEFQNSSRKLSKRFYIGIHIGPRIQIHTRFQFIVLDKKLQFRYFYTFSYFRITFCIHQIIHFHCFVGPDNSNEGLECFKRGTNLICNPSGTPRTVQKGQFSGSNVCPGPTPKNSFPKSGSLLAKRRVSSTVFATFIRAF